MRAELLLTSKLLSQPEVRPKGGEARAPKVGFPLGVMAICLGLGHPQGLRFGGCTSVPISVFSQLEAGFESGEVGFLPPKCVPQAFS